MASNRGRIQITTGPYSDACTVQNDLLAAQAQYPEIREMLEIANRRYLCTLLTSGVVGPYGINNDEKTKIPDVETRGKGIGDNAYKFRIQGRIERASVITEQIGSTSADGSFVLRMRDRNLNKGDTCVFNGGRFVATVMSQPRGNESSGFIYDFQSPSGDLFVWATHVGGQSGSKTCFAAYSSFGEKSLKGYGYSKFPDMFINHMTIQRESVSISGDAASSVLWYKYVSSTGKEAAGWMYEEIAQANAKIAIKNERQKWVGVSTMKNADGSLRATSRLTDQETGLPIVAGDGFEEQVAGGNVAYGSGLNGAVTIDDYKDILQVLENDSDQVSGLTFVDVTGTVGFGDFQTEAVNLYGNQNVQLFESVNQSEAAGGTKLSAGYTFMRINMAGNSMWVVKHPMFDDSLIWTERGSDGKLLMSRTHFIMSLGEGSNKNLEILYKSANGVNRKRVEAKLNGMTGAGEVTISQEDAMTYAILQQDMLNVYNTKTCAIIYPNS